jgi:hypothetical protein
VYIENKTIKSYFLTGILPWIFNPEHQHILSPNLELEVTTGYSGSYSGGRGRTVVKGQPLQNPFVKQTKSKRTGRLTQVLKYWGKKPKFKTC